jgi:AraC-like DNA-binding protein
MPSDYREIRPSSRLAPTVECIWTMRHRGPDAIHRVVPDACTDVLFTIHASGAKLEVVGAMTAWRDYPLREGDMMAGVRFHPGMGRAVMGLPADRVTDAIVPLGDLWGSRSRLLLEQLENTPPEGWPSVFEPCFRDAEHLSPIQKVLAWMVERRGMVSINDLAGQSGFSARQFRRVCLEQSGLTPKFLARVLRFRHAQALAERHRRQFAELALACGYYDQAHLIRDFREFSGRTPASCGMAVFSNRTAGAPR